jgi:hypothetical protein
MFQYNELGVTDYQNTRFVNGRDLCWEAIVKILQKKANRNLPAGVGPCPIIYDVNSLTSSIPTKEVNVTKSTKDGKTITEKITGSENNVYKLGLLMRYMDTAKLFDLVYLDLIESVKRDSDNMTTGKFKNYNKNGTYWNANTLLPYQLVNYNADSSTMKNNINALGYSTQDGYDNTYNTMSKEGINIYNADTSIVMNFNDPKITNTKNTKEAFDYYGLGSGDKLTPAKVIRFLLDYPVEEVTNITKLSILEIQPFESYKTRQQWIEFVAEMLPGFKEEGLTIKHMTSKEFNCHIEELVGTYDLVYIGLNKPTTVQPFDLSDHPSTTSHFRRTTPRR